MNEFLFLATVLICIIGITILYQKLGYDGLNIWIVFSTIISFLASFKTITLYGFNINISIPFINSIYLSLFIITEKYPKKQIKKSIITSIYSLLVVIIFFMLIYLYKPGIYDNKAIYLTNFITTNYINMIIFPIILLLSEYLIIKIYKYIKSIHENTFIKNCLSITLISIIDTFIYLFLVYNFSNKTNNYQAIIIASFTFKIMCSIIYTPLMYYFENAKKVIK